MPFGTDLTDEWRFSGWLDAQRSRTDEIGDLARARHAGSRNDLDDTELVHRAIAEWGAHLWLRRVRTEPFRG